MKKYEKVEEIGLPKQEIIERAKTRSLKKIPSYLEKISFFPHINYVINDKEFFNLNEKRIDVILGNETVSSTKVDYIPFIYKSYISKLVPYSENKRYGIIDLLNIFLISKKPKRRIIMDMLDEYLGLFDHADRNLYSTFWREFLDITREKVKNVEVSKKYDGALSTLELKNKKYDNVWTPVSVMAGIVDDSNIKIERKLLKKHNKIDLLEKYPECFVFKDVKDHKDISKNHDEVIRSEYKKIDCVQRTEGLKTEPDYFASGVGGVPLWTYFIYLSTLFKEVDVDFYDIGGRIVGIKVSPNYLKKPLQFDKTFRREKVETQKSMINRLKEDYKVTIDVYLSDYQNKKEKLYEESGEKELDTILPKDGVVNLKYGNRESSFKVQDEDEFMIYLSVADNVFLRK